jgi:N-acetylglutamate synthase-like GNAT family acetyltransferase
LDVVTSERTARALTAPGVIALVALDGTTVVGVAELLTDGEVMGYLGLLVVAERVRGRGIGETLVSRTASRTSWRPA